VHGSGRDDPCRLAEGIKVHELVRRVDVQRDPRVDTANMVDDVDADLALLMMHPKLDH
jgi:hypothetical protein